MAVNFAKPRSQVVRVFAPLTGAFDPNPRQVNVTYATAGQLLLRYVRSGDALAGTRPLMKVQTMDSDGRLYDLTLEDGTITATSDGFQTDVDSGIKRLPARTGNWSYILNLAFARVLVVSFLEDDPGATFGSLGATLDLSSG